MGEKDIAEKILASFNDVFADIINGLIFDGRQIVQEDDLTDATPMGYYKASGKVHEQTRDIAKRWMGRDICLSLSILSVILGLRETVAWTTNTTRYIGQGHSARAGRTRTRLWNESV